ncbi:small subunit rRNA synthesis-associated protein, putative [Babesia caballi]|uniref:Small subunit rRNA synthesis-associated protein, putative n=1 Tax=Babesia caballi TaxID=5871 RepID=A0AAV4LZ01_BABCB|nr:small subunit rRNA synthesis-associated protein, putative [Babesia caballi]
MQPKQLDEEPIALLTTDVKNERAVERKVKREGGESVEGDDVDADHVRPQVGAAHVVSAEGHVAWQGLGDVWQSEAEDDEATPRPVESGEMAEEDAARAWLRTRSNYIKNNSFVERAQREESFASNHSRKNKEFKRPLLKDPDLPNTQWLHAVSYNENVTIEIQGAGLPAWGAETEKGSSADALLGRSFALHKTTVEFCAYSSGFGLGSANWTITHGESRTCIAVVGETGEVDHGRFCRAVDLSFAPKVSLAIILDNAVSATGAPAEVKVEKRRKREIKREQALGKCPALDEMCRHVVEGLQNPEGVVLVTDPYCDVLLDVLEHLQCYMRDTVRQHEQVFIYAIGEGMVELLSFADKCAEWVEMSRAERTMHHENPSSPFPVIADMREGNRLFVGNTTDDVKDVYRFPSVVVATYTASTVAYLTGRMHAGASLVTTGAEYTDELVAAAAANGVQPKVATVALDFRARPEHLLRMMGPKARVAVSERMKTLLPGSLNVLAGDAVKLPVASPSGLLRAELRKSEVERLLARGKPLGGRTAAAAVDVTLHEGDVTRVTASAFDADDAKFTFGTFTPQQLLEKLAQRGLGGCTVRGQPGEYPVEIVVDDECVVVLESRYETCVDTDSEQKRQVVTQALEELCAAL